MSLTREERVKGMGKGKQIIYKCPRCGLEQMLLDETARISKARDILSDPQIAFYGSPESYDCMIRRALDALEGK